MLLNSLAKPASQANNIPNKSDITRGNRHQVSSARLAPAGRAHYRRQINIPTGAAQQIQSSGLRAKLERARAIWPLVRLSACRRFRSAGEEEEEEAARIVREGMAFKRNNLVVVV